MRLNDVETTIIRNSLGLLRAKSPYRNHYCAPTDGDTHATLELMAKRGLVEPGRVINEGRHRMYHVTDAGAAAIGSHLPAE